MNYMLHRWYRWVSILADKASDGCSWKCCKWWRVQQRRKWFPGLCPVCFILWIMLSVWDLPMWPSGQSTRVPCAVEHDALKSRGLNLNPGASAYRRIILNNSYAHDERGDNPRQEKEGSTVSSINGPLMTRLLAASRLLAVLAWAEANKIGWHWLAWHTPPVRGLSQTLGHV